MAGKHSSGGHARKQNKGAGKTVMIVVIAVAVIAALAVGVIWLRNARRPEEIPGEVAIAAATLPPEEIEAPKEEPVVQLPEEETVPEGLPEEIEAPREEPETEVTGPEVLGGDEEEKTLERAEFTDIYSQAGIEPVYQIQAFEGVGYAVFARGSRENGISQYEFLYEDDRVLIMAETSYGFFPDVSTSELEDIVSGLEEASQPPEGAETVTVTGEMEEGYMVLQTLIEGLDDPNVVEFLSQQALIPAYTDGGYLSYSDTAENMIDMGYAER